MMKAKTMNDLGLAITCLDSDRLRDWAEKLDTHGSDISHWADRRFVSEQLRAVAGRIEATVREVGTLREMAGISIVSDQETAGVGRGPQDRLRLADDCRFFAASADRHGTPWAVGVAYILREAADALAALDASREQNTGEKTMDDRINYGETGTVEPWLSIDGQHYSREECAAAYEKALCGETLTQAEARVVGGWLVHPLVSTRGLAPYGIAHLLLSRQRAASCKQFQLADASLVSQEAAPPSWTCQFCGYGEFVLYGRALKVEHEAQCPSNPNGRALASSPAPQLTIDQELTDSTRGGTPGSQRDARTAGKGEGL